MGHVNVIWQGDANSVCFRSLKLTDSPAEVLSVTGAKTLSVRSLAERFAERFGTNVTFEGERARNGASQRRQQMSWPVWGAKSFRRRDDRTHRFLDRVGKHNNG